MSPYHMLPLTLKDKRTIFEVEEFLVEKSFRKYEGYITRDKRVNLARWKHIKSKDDLHVYAKKTLPRSGVCCEPDLCCVNPVDVNPVDANPVGVNPVVLSVGTLKGKLDDLMFGTVNPTTDIMHVKASYVNDYSDGAVLATLVSPTSSDPFRSVTVKWLQIDLPLSRTGLLHDRDFICVEASGILHFANGERVGYMMLHSIDSPLTQPLPNVVRARHTCTWFFRQIAPNVIDTFCFDTVQAGGSLMEAVVLPVCANALLSATNYVECGLMKKLTWNLQRRRAAMRTGSVPPARRYHGVCTTCNRNLQTRCSNRLGMVTCKMCECELCIGCKVVKTISFLSPDSKLLRHKITFCVTCVRNSNDSSAMDAARDQAVGYQAYNVF
ncbi:unnamed protein product [Phytophthora fragariaefolia]|uniref:Unnamed protein product n=1 Tax=Phytophthora fragariaefolia TaxID=1490495 RepID=A0A9W6XMG9_9STRA|nr:unnamed protein product [Phytophthora fragariaefolia]